MRSLIVLGSIVAMLCPAVFADHGAKHFSVTLPDEWRDARRIRVRLENVTSPADRAFKIRVAIKRAGDESLTLGSVPVQAIGRTRAGNRSIPFIRLDVTRALRRILENGPDTTKVEMVLEAVGPRGEHIEGLEWDVSKVEFETTK